MLRYGTPTKDVGVIAQSYSRFADLLQVTFDGGDAHRFITETGQNETPAVNSSIRRMEVKMSRRDWSGVLEDKLNLTVEIALDLFLQAISIA